MKTTMRLLTNYAFRTAATIAVTIVACCAGAQNSGPPTGKPNPAWVQKQAVAANTEADCWNSLTKGQYAQVAAIARAQLDDCEISGRFEVLAVQGYVLNGQLYEAEAVVKVIRESGHYRASELHTLVCGLVDGLVGRCSETVWTDVIRLSKGLSETEQANLPQTISPQNLAILSQLIFTSQLSNSPYHGAAIWNAELALRLAPNNSLANGFFGSLAWDKAVSWEGKPWSDGKAVLNDRALLKRAVEAMDKSMDLFTVRDTYFKAKRAIASELLQN